MIMQKKFDEHFPDLEVKEGHMLLTDLTVETFTAIFNAPDIGVPKKILEIGFNAGHSAFGFLEMFPETVVHSIDLGRHTYTRPCAQKIQSIFGERFKFGVKNSHDITPDNIIGENYDMVYIDGDHSKKGISNDYDICNKAKVEWILIDDYNLFRNIRELVDHIHISSDHPYTVRARIKFDNNVLLKDPEAKESHRMTTAILLQRTGTTDETIQ